jgi:hypothetical protein
MSPNVPATQPPTAADLLASPVVQKALDEAWVASLADDPVRRHEEGGWIYMNLSTGALSVIRLLLAGQSSIDLSGPPVVAGAVVVGKFHTHPNPTAEGWIPGPSPSDIQIDAQHGVPDLIRADDGIHLSGPSQRRGGLSGGPGYPP